MLAVVVPGAGLLWARRRLPGALLMATALVLGALAGWVLLEPDHVVNVAFDADGLRIAAIAGIALVVVWAIGVVATYVVVRPRPLTWWKEGLGATVVLGVCLALAAPVVVLTRYSTVQADLVTEVFENNRTATAPREVSVADPWGGQERVNVLLLGGDGSVTRPGIRTDSVILVSLDTGTGDTAMFSLPRNLMDVPFPADSPLHALYPDGFQGPGDPGFWLLNAVYGQVPLLHPGLMGTSENEGADAIKQAVSGALGIPVDYYVLVNLGGFQQIVDAIGGVTVNINEAVAIHGNTDLGIPPVGYLEPGPAQRLNGYQALWFARGRWGSDDYQRMLRQRCLVRALIDEAQPLTLLRRYEDLVEAGKGIVRTDVPADLLPAFVELALAAKDASIRSVAFVPSDRFAPANPDYVWVQNTVRRTLARAAQATTPATPLATPRPIPSPTTSPTPIPTTGPTPIPTTGTQVADPGDAVSVADSCVYAPDGS